MIVTLILSCGETPKNDAGMPTESKAKTAKDILGNPDYLAMSYGGYRLKSREEQPTDESTSTITVREEMLMMLIEKIETDHQQLYFKEL